MAPRTLEDAQHDAEAVGLRNSGFTYRQIAAAQGINTATAHRRVKRALAAVPSEAVHEMRRIEGERLDDLWKIAWREATRDHLFVQSGKIVRDENGEPLIDHAAKLQAVRTCVALSERRARLEGLDAPVRIRHEVITEDVLDAEIARLAAELAERETPDVGSESALPG